MIGVVSSIDEGCDQIGDGRAKVDEAVTVVESARATFEELSGTFASLNADGQSAAMANVAQQLERAAAALGNVATALDETRSAADAAGKGLHAGSGAGPSASTAPVPKAAPSTPPFKPMRTDPAKRDEIAPHVGKDYAVATLWDANGNRVLGLHSADDDGPAATARWKEPWGSYPRLRRHVEAHAAARMHRDGHKQMAMYINLPPCSYPDGCKYNLADILPEGSTLWVHRVRRSGTTKVRRYRGTGKAYE